MTTQELQVLVDQAEDYRKMGNHKAAVSVAGRVIAPNHKLISPYSLSTISQDKSTLQHIACLARIYVDSLKSMANTTWNIKDAYTYIDAATRAAFAIYLHGDVGRELQGIHEDYVGREQYFLEEMNRDEVKILFAASALYDLQIATRLIFWGQHILEVLYKKLDEQHPVRPLVGLEYQLSRFSQRKDVDNEQIHTDFTKLKDHNQKTNPDRVATLASQLLVWASINNNRTIAHMGKNALQNLSQDNPAYVEYVKRERNKVLYAFIRTPLFRTLSPYVIDSHEKHRIHMNMDHLALHAVWKLGKCDSE